MDPIFAEILFVAAMLSVLIACSTITGPRAFVVFAAFYPAMIVWAGALVCTIWLGLVWLGLVPVE